MGSSQIRAQTHVPCINRQILNHCATREALTHPFCLSSWLTQSFGHLGFVLIVYFISDHFFYYRYVSRHDHFIQYLQREGNLQDGMVD